MAAPDSDWEDASSASDNGEPRCRACQARGRPCALPGCDRRDQPGADRPSLQAAVQRAKRLGKCREFINKLQNRGCGCHCWSPYIPCLNCSVRNNGNVQNKKAIGKGKHKNKVGHRYLVYPNRALYF